MSLGTEGPAKIHALLQFDWATLPETKDGPIIVVVICLIHEEELLFVCIYELLISVLHLQFSLIRATVSERVGGHRGATNAAE